MALATRCPSCHALFRVVADQLKLRGGLVRCGACGHVFDAIGTLSYLDDASVRPAVATALAPVETDAAAESAHVEFTPQAVEIEAAPPVESPAPAGDAAAPVAEQEATLEAIAEPAAASDQVETVEEAPAPEPAETPAADAATKATPSVAAEPPATEPPTAEDQAAPPPIEDAAAPDMDEPTFLQQANRPRRRVVTLAYALGAALAALALALQFVLMYRAEIAAQLPATRPALASVCQVIRCTVGWPMHGELLAIVGSELQSLPGTNALELTAVVRNRAAITLALPALEVTLTDTQNRAVARRIFAPAEYLPPSEATARLADGLQAGADMTVRITFEARGLNVAGFVVYPFYL